MGVIRKLIKINTWFWIITLSVFLLGVYVLFSVPVFAVERSDIQNNENRITDLERDIENLKVDAQIKRDEIAKQESEIDILKDILREVKRQAGESWDAVLEITNAEDDLNNGIDTMDSMKNELLSILNLQSEYVREIIMLEDQITNTERLLKSKVNMESYTKLIGIDISRNCITLIKNDIETQCPGYDLLKQIDSSNVVVSGDWITPDNFTKRDVSPFSDSWRWYDQDDQLRIIVDPPTGMTERIKMITITNNFETFFTSEDLKLENNVRTWHEGRYVDKCKTAIVSADDWKKWLPDTIHYLRTGCQVTGLDEIQRENMTKTEIDITTSPNYQYQLWLDEVKDNCKERC